MDKILEVKNLKISFRTSGGTVKAVRDISMDLERGRTIAIVGESGSGKSVTSKAVMGILAGNSIVEGGEILYDGQDLLKISEEDYHKIRGDKIAMIFQDPLSSLNPIMRIGQQLTEAMILKAKTGKKNAKKEFNNRLKLLQQNIVASGHADAAQVSQMLKKFDTFCIAATKIEGAFNEAYGNVVEAEVLLKDTILLLQRKKKVDLGEELNKYIKLFSDAANPFVIPAEQSAAYVKKLKALRKAGKQAKNEDVLVVLEEGQAMVQAVLAMEKPNFFTLGYYQMVNPDADLSKMPVGEMNKMTRQFLDNDFLLNFIKVAESGVQFAHDQAIAAKQEALPLLQEALAYFQAGKIEHKQAENYAKVLSAKVDHAVDRLSVKKESVEYVFRSALHSAIEDYFEGIRKNPIEEKKYLRNKKKYTCCCGQG